jgi:hypothetical protein
VRPLSRSRLVNKAEDHNATHMKSKQETRPKDSFLEK